MEENEEREAQGERYETNPEILISKPTLNPPSTRPQTLPEPFEESNPALGQIEILRALEVMERDFVAIADSFTSLFSSLHLAISNIKRGDEGHGQSSYTAKILEEKRRCFRHSREQAPPTSMKFELLRSVVASRA